MLRTGVGGGHWFVTAGYERGGGGQKGPKTALRNIWTTPYFYQIFVKYSIKNGNLRYFVNILKRLI